MPRLPRWLLITLACALAGAALLLPHGPVGPAHPWRALAQATVCGGPEVEREATPVELEFLTALNAHRQARGLVILTPSPRLMRAARFNATRLATSTAGVPTSADLDVASRDWMRRLVDCGVPSTVRVGETLGAIPGAADAAMVLMVWLDGDANQRLLEDPAYQLVGVAAVETDTATVWVLDLAATPG